MFALDTNILVYAHNRDSKFNEIASTFVEKVMNDRDSNGKLKVCIPSQVITEFINVITRHNNSHANSIKEAVLIIQDYLNTGVTVIHHKNSQVSTLIELLENASTRKKVFDIALAATLKDNNISGLYTANTRDFEEFDFLNVINPIVEDQQ